MKNWKTTLGGVAGLLAGLAAAIKLFLTGDIAGAVTAAVSGISALVVGLNAQDAPKP